MSCGQPERAQLRGIIHKGNHLQGLKEHRSKGNEGYVTSLSITFSLLKYKILCIHMGIITMNPYICFDERKKTNSDL